MKAIQDCIPGNHCFGCGPENAQGLHLKSFVEGDEVVARYAPEGWEAAGPTHLVNGGILATLIDCHGVCTAIADSYRAAGRELGSSPLLWNVTASLRVEYLAPTPMAGPLELRARVREVKGRKRVVECVVHAGGRACARGEVVAVEVPPTWFDGTRP